jgi:release factor glutamine methyltransferase
MTDNQAFRFLSRFAPAHDVKVILNEMRGPHRAFHILWIAWRLRRSAPVAKIIHKKWFYGLGFYTNKHTMDPRPDSETLVASVLAHNNGKVKILDLGTGTGCLICSIIKNLPGATGVGIDKSSSARRVARRNVRMLGLSNRIKIVRGTFSHCNADGFDVVIANPPYIPTGDSHVNLGAKHDPKMALYAGADGLKYYREIAGLRAPRIYLEIGAGQERAVREIFSAAGWTFASRHRDLSGRIRVLSFIQPFCD